MPLPALLACLDHAWSTHQVLRRPDARPAVIHRRLVGHGIVGLHLKAPRILHLSPHLHRIVPWRWLVLLEDLRLTRVRPIDHAAHVSARSLLPVAPLLVDVPKEVDLQAFRDPNRPTPWPGS